MLNPGRGLVIKRYSGFYYVQLASTEIIECKLRGKVKDSPILVGDRVGLSLSGEKEGIIEEVMPRTMELLRPPVANVDQIIVVMSTRSPAPSLQLLDRLLVQAEHRGLQTVLAVNKCDLGLDNPAVATIREYYPLIGYQVILTSARDGTGIEVLREAMEGHINVLSGPSGVGKSSLLNQIIPGLTMQTGEVSKKIGRGKHTTRHVELVPLPGRGLVADTPGFSSVDLPEIRREELASLFAEFETPSETCRFKDCMHFKEIDCGVKSAVSDGSVSTSRHQNYLEMLGELMERERCYR